MSLVVILIGLAYTIYDVKVITHNKIRIEKERGYENS